MRAIAAVLSCAALLSCSTAPDGPKSPLLGEAVRAPGVVWSTDTLNCRQISSEDGRIDALSKATEIERHQLVRERNIQLVQWLIPYYGWVATARAGLIDEKVKKADIVIEDARDRRQELKQFALAEGCAGAAGKVIEATALAPVVTAPTAPPSRPTATRALGHQDPHPAHRNLPAAAAAPVITTPPARPAAATTSVAPELAAKKSESESPVADQSVILPLGPGADVDRAAADITAALQRR